MGPAAPELDPAGPGPRAARPSHCDGAGSVAYGYDNANRLSNLAEPGGTCTSPTSKCTTFAYDNADRRTSTVFPTSPAVTQAITYDGAGNLTRIKATRADTPTPTVLTDFAYTYVKSGSTTTDRQLRQSMTNTAGVTTTYGYDAFGQLTSADVSGGTSTDQAYCYDASGNRTTKAVGSTSCASGTITSYTYNDADELTSATGQTSTPAYDGNGNETTGPNGRTSTYTALDQTASITPSGGSAFNMSYADATNTERTSGGGRNFADSILGLAQQSKTSEPTINYVHDVQGNLVARLTSTTRHYYLVDGLGSVIKLVDNTGAVTNEYAYDSWGAMTVVTAGVLNPFRYAAGYYDTETGLTKFGARYYDPALGRWTQRDPSGMDEMAYAYAGNDPCTSADPSGLDRVEPGPFRKRCPRIRLSTALSAHGNALQALFEGVPAAALGWTAPLAASLSDFGDDIGRLRRENARLQACLRARRRPTGLV